MIRADLSSPFVTVFTVYKRLLHYAGRRILRTSRFYYSMNSTTQWFYYSKGLDDTTHLCTGSQSLKLVFEIQTTAFTGSKNCAHQYNEAVWETDLKRYKHGT